jgi:hypothetical protein
MNYFIMIKYSSLFFSLVFYGYAQVHNSFVTVMYRVVYAQAQLRDLDQYLIITSFKQYKNRTRS